MNKPDIIDIFQQTEIVQNYPRNITNENIYLTPQTIKRKIFGEDLLEELQRTNIVEDYLSLHEYIQKDEDKMDIEEEERMDQQPYQQLFSNEKSPIFYRSQKMLDSQSSGRQIPSRNSSVSSMSQKQQKNIPSSSYKTFLIHQQRQDTGVGKNNRRKRDVGGSAQKRQRALKVKKIQEEGCNCKKSRCLKMYCECFNLQLMCGPNCNCCDCANCPDNTFHKKAVIEALTRNPKAFAEDAQQINDVFQLGINLSQVRKGCKCKKTQCRKKYCECFNSGFECGIFCQCEGCSNTSLHNKIQKSKQQMSINLNIKKEKQY